MYTSDDFPPRVTLSPDGTYRWTGIYSESVEKQENSMVTKVTLGSVGGICIFFILMGTALSLKGGSWDIMPAVLIPCLVIMAITGVILKLFTGGRGGTEKAYEMNEYYVRWGQGTRTSIFFDYKKITEVRISRENCLIELKKRAGYFVPIFVPREDFRFVNDYITQRLPGTAKVTYL